MKLRVLSSLIIISSFFLMTSCLNDSGSPSTNDQLANDISKIDDYLLAHNITALRDITGIRFTIDSVGSGHAPRYNSEVTFDYTGKLLDETVFQKSSLKNVKIDGLIAGFQIGLPLIPNGTKATLYIPSSYAYGSQAQPGIPAGSCLIFNIKLKAITVTAAERSQLVSDTVKINQYLTNNSIIAQKDSSGLKYVITQMGTGLYPFWWHKVKIAYTGYLLIDGIKGAKFYEGTNEPGEASDSRVVNYIRGFQIGLQKLPKGSKASFFIPSGMGFGPQAVTGGLVTIPANSNLFYEVELIDVMNP